MRRAAIIVLLEQPPSPCGGGHGCVPHIATVCRGSASSRNFPGPALTDAATSEIVEMVLAVDQQAYREHHQ